MILQVDKLKEVYEQVKLHPYRLNQDKQYLESYKNILYKLSHEFYMAFKITKYKTCDMIHNFNRSISYIGEERIFVWKNKQQNNSEYHVELCIGVIHKFLDTGEILFYHEYYTGVNRLQGLPYIYKVVWDDFDKRFYPDYSIEELLSAIKEIEKKWEEKPEIKKHEYSIYNEMYHNWLRDLLRRKLLRG